MRNLSNFRSHCAQRVKTYPPKKVKSYLQQCTFHNACTHGARPGSGQKTSSELALAISKQQGMDESPGVGFGEYYSVADLPLMYAEPGSEPEMPGPSTQLGLRGVARPATRLVQG